MDVQNEAINMVVYYLLTPVIIPSRRFPVEHTRDVDSVTPSAFGLSGAKGSQLFNNSDSP